MSRTRSAAATAKRAERLPKSAVTTQTFSLIGPKRKVPLHIVLRNYPAHERVNALVDAAIAEGDEGDLLVDLISAVRRMSWALDNPHHRANVARQLHTAAVVLNRTTIRIVRRKVEPNILVTLPVSEIRA